MLVFYPWDFAPFCTTEMCAYRDASRSAPGKGARILTARDSTWTHKAFKEREGLTHTLLADMKGDVGCTATGTKRRPSPSA